jgi:hypothetical protein
MAPRRSGKLPAPQVMFSEGDNFTFVHEFEKKIDIFEICLKFEKIGYRGKIVNPTHLQMKKDDFIFSLRDDSKLIMRCQSGDKKHQEYVVNQHFHKMYLLLK